MVVVVAVVVVVVVVVVDVVGRGCRLWLWKLVVVLAGCVRTYVCREYIMGPA